ncbi:paraquat-inducible protein A [Tenacibaculum dicentrarchi]|nr:paraquat-inducible protein A [Tenacibaculum dicentrarchi]
MKSFISNSILTILFLSLSFSSFQSYYLENNKRELKSDLIELSDIKYGMFNVDEWKNQLAKIITAKLKKLKLTGNDREIVKKKIETFLYRAIADYEINYKKTNNENSLFGISYKTVGANVFGIFSGLKERVPTITEEILNFLEKEENRENIKEYILLQLDRYRDSTFQKIDYSNFENILAKYNSTELINCKKIINNNIDNINSRINLYNLVILFVYVIILLNIFFIKKHSNYRILLYLLTSFLLLTLGVLLPMIDIDARISIMEFNLMGETISFQNQVLYFKSKSIFEMSKIMLLEGKIKVMLVGLLVILFSVIFPISKLLSSIILIYKKRFKNNKIISFLVFRSGKWSMADVMVVAIFMSYIGFTGIISSQLTQLEKISASLNILTTNNSELQNGFYFFLSFVIMSIGISQIITMKDNEKPTGNNV